VVDFIVVEIPVSTKSQDNDIILKNNKR
jgi:hypothetical protein